MPLKRLWIESTDKTGLSAESVGLWVSSGLAQEAHYRREEFFINPSPDRLAHSLDLVNNFLAVLVTRKWRVNITTFWQASVKLFWGKDFYTVPGKERRVLKAWGNRKGKELGNKGKLVQKKIEAIDCLWFVWGAMFFSKSLYVRVCAWTNQ